MSNLYNRFFCAFGGVFGAAGIASYAAAAHLGGYYDAMAPIFLGNAPILIVAAFLRTGNLLIRLGCILIIFGVCLFTSTLGIQEWFGFKLFPYSAPIGGTATILGWLLFSIAALIPGNSKNTRI